MENKKIDYMMLFKAFLIFVLSSVLSVVIFATIMYFLEGGYEYSPLFATASLGIGCFFASWFLGLKIGKKGILIGLLTGIIVFVAATLISLSMDNATFSVHTSLRLVIFLLSSMIGAIIGVNRNGNKKYI